MDESIDLYLDVSLSLSLSLSLSEISPSRVSTKNWTTLKGSNWVDHIWWIFWASAEFWDYESIAAAGLRDVILSLS